MLDEDAVAAYRQTLKTRLERKRRDQENARVRAFQAALEVIPVAAARFQSIEAVYLFGSVTSSGLFHAHSDIDVALVGANARDYFDFWASLETALPEYIVDLRDFHASETFSQRIRESGVLVYERDNPSTASRDPQ